MRLGNITYSLIDTELFAEKKINTAYITTPIIICALLGILLLAFFKLKKANGLLQKNARQADQRASK